MIVLHNILFAIVLLMSMVTIAPVIAESKHKRLNNDVVFNPLMTRAWSNKINYFIMLGKGVRDIQVTRKSLNQAISRDTFDGDYDASMLSFTAGGNLFDKTSLHLALTLNRFNLIGNIHYRGSNVNSDESVEYQRNKTLTELFVEHELSSGVSVGVDAYYSADVYRNASQEGDFLDEEFGLGLLLSRQFKVKHGHYRGDYIVSHRRVNSGINEVETLKRTFHNVMLTYSYQWNYDFSTDVNTRLSYYPIHDPLSYWDNDVIYAFGGALNYRLSSNNEIVFKAERMSLGHGDHLNIFSLTIEHHFGKSKSKRRKRRHKIPQLLIK